MSKEIKKELLSNIKLVCSDVDGTLVEEGKGGLNPEYYDEIRRLKEKGILFAVVSGRSYEAASPLFGPVLDDIIFINDNGAVLRENGNIIRTHSIDNALAKEIIQDMEARKKGSSYISSLTGSYAWKGNQRLCEILRNDFHLDVKELERMPEDLPDNAGVTSMALYDSVDAIKVAGEKFCTKWGQHDRIRAVCAGQYWFNIIQRNVNKGTALQELMERYGFGKDEVLAVGDNMNDLEMLTTVTNSVAIGNARQEIKDVCRFIADTNENDGVLQILKML